MNLSKDDNTEIKAFLRTNNFDFLRFFFALIVMLVHAHVLTNNSKLSVFSQYLSSEIAVKGFFVISGFLIFMSYENSEGICSYFKKRFKRIYPAYFVVITAAVMVGLVYNYYHHSLVSSLSDTAKYYVANLFFLNFLHPTLPNLLTNNQLNAVNGALWTLKIEVMFYMFVPFASYLFAKVGRIHTLILLYIISLIYTYFTLHLANVSGQPSFIELQRQLPGQLTFFLVGTAAYYYHSILKKYIYHLILLVAISYTFKQEVININAWHIIEPIALGLTVIYFATVFPYLGKFSKYGDFSYGVYILHFPILQALVAFGFFESNVYKALFFAVSITLISAILLWHIVEKRFLNRSNHYNSKHV